MSTIKTNIIEPLGSSLTISGNASAVSFTGNGTIPVGGIILWSGSIASIPANWQLCDGTNGTPDLRNRFIVGAGSLYSPANVGGTANSIVVEHTHQLFSDIGYAQDALPSVGANEYAAVKNVEFQAYLNYNIVGGASNPVPTLGRSSTAGSSGTNANLPPYYALAYIMRVA